MATIKNYDDELEKIQQKIKKALWIVMLSLFAILVVFNTFYQVSAGHRGVILTFGEASMMAQSEGLHIKVPFIQNIVIMNVQTQKYEAALTAASKDLQDVKTKIAINYHIVPEQVPEIYRDIGVAYAEKVIYPLEQEINKEATAQFTAEELVTKRNEVREMMIGKLTTKLQARGIVVEELSIIDFQFSEAFTQAIEAKVTAEQSALQARNKLEQIKFEAQQVEAAAIGQKNAKIATATGDAEAIRIIDEQLKRSPTYIEYYKLQKWDGMLSKVVGANPLINVGLV